MLKLLTSVMLMPLVLSAAEKPASDKPTSNDKTPILTVANRSDTPVVFSAAEIEKLPHVELRTSKDRVYTGVPVYEFLRRTGVIWEGHCSPLLTCYVLVEGADGYRVLFSIPEIDPEQCHKMVILADCCNGKPLGAAEGSFETIEEDAKQKGRWVRHAAKISLVQALPRSRPKVK
jgi:hypothetical protein